jgi:hypothetical protein
MAEERRNQIPVEDEESKQPAANKLTKQKIAKLFRMFCVHVVEYEGGAHYGGAEDCSLCLLRDIPFDVQVPRACDKKTDIIERDLCFAIWHERILEVKS